MYIFPEICVLSQVFSFPNCCGHVSLKTSKFILQLWVPHIFPNSNSNHIYFIMNLYYYMVPHARSYLLTVSVFIKCYASLLRNSMEQPKHAPHKDSPCIFKDTQICYCFVKSPSLRLSGSMWIQSTQFSKIYFKTLLPYVSEVFWSVSSL